MFVWTNYWLPVAPVAAELERMVRDEKDCDRRLCALPVTDANERAMQLQALVSSSDLSHNWDLRCRIRVGPIAFIQVRFPESPPQSRGEEIEPAARSGRAARRRSASSLAAAA